MFSFLSYILRGHCFWRAKLLIVKGLFETARLKMQNSIIGPPMLKKLCRSKREDEYASSILKLEGSLIQNRID